MAVIKALVFQLLLFVGAAYLGNVLSSLLITSSFLALKRPAGFLIVSVVNTIPYMLAGVPLVLSHRYGVLNRRWTLGIFLLALAAYQAVSVFVSARLLNFTRTEGYVTTFADGVPTVAGILVRGIDVTVIAAAFVLSINLLGIWRGVRQHEQRS